MVLTLMLEEVLFEVYVLLELLTLLSALVVIVML